MLYILQRYELLATRNTCTTDPLTATFGYQVLSLVSAGYMVCM